MTLPNDRTAAELESEAADIAAGRAREEWTSAMTDPTSTSLDRREAQLHVDQTRAVQLGDPPVPALGQRPTDIYGLRQPEQDKAEQQLQAALGGLQLGALVEVTVRGRRWATARLKGGSLTVDGVPIALILQPLAPGTPPDHRVTVPWVSVDSLEPWRGDAQ